jgi:hypothetical protein
LTEAAQQTSPQAPRAADRILAPLLVWLAVQMFALGLAALRVPLSARYPQPEESLAVHVLVVAQVAAAALLFPFLFRSIISSIIVIASAIPFLQLAAFLATFTDNRRLALCAAYLTLWLTGLAILNASLRCQKLKVYGVAAVSLMSLGGAVIAYLHREFGAPASAFDWQTHASLGPIMGCMAILEANPLGGTIWVFLGAFVGSALMLLVFHFWRRKRATVA